jgi:1,4-dihydroxy-2-naphthoate octaprenyltransferase
LKKIKLIFRLARLHFLVLGFLLYLLGYILALLEGIEFDLTKFLFGYLVFGTAHLSVSFSNDYFDRHSDRKSVKTHFSGGSKVLVEHPELEYFAVSFAVFLLVISAVFCVLFIIIYNYSLWFFVFVLSGGLLGWFYSSTPIKLAYRGLGEISTMLGVGFFMTGMGYFVGSGVLGSLLLLFSLPLSFYGLFFIITVELPDVECDILGNKKNITTIFGVKRGKLISFTAVLSGTIYFLVMLYLKISNNLIDWTPIFIFSFLPLFASIISILWNNKNRKTLVKQVMLNMGSLTTFVIIIIVILFLQSIP